MALRGVLLDFSGTLFRLEPGASPLHSYSTADGEPISPERVVELFALMTIPTGTPAHLPAELHEDWHRRDLDPAVHRAAYEASLGSPDLGLAADVPGKLYDRMLDPESWVPFPDTADVLRGLDEAGIKVAVLSNIPWDLRPTFAAHGIAEHVDEFVLSYAEGLVKPDPKIFELACERLGVEPAEALMIGDSAEADGAATAIGCAFELVKPLPTETRPDSLLRAVRAHGVAV
ncbi:HAD family hydrolase [Actinokineospora pegani]|uniref:HAD family hydrolase n=1 Tax=Actinokineospora pegani TaxID=2654637 RepID=UPI0012EA74C4|nr:HAD-IA family hydrolase [Actinokineospora pegani]